MSKNKSERKTIRNKLDKLWRLIIRSGGCCELCGSRGKLDAHHIEGRSPMHLRWDLENGIALCFRCHRLGVHSEASSVQAEFREKIASLRGYDTLEKLKQMRYKIKKYGIQDLSDLHKHYQEKLENIEQY